MITLGCFSPLSFAQPCNSIVSIEWLLGHWAAEDGESTLTESWEKVSPLTFEGSGETRSGASNKLQTSESLRLIEMSNEVFYLAKVEHNDFPVAFKLTQCSNNSAVFENSLHDFPQKIEYQLGIHNELTVAVSSGKNSGFKISFIRRDDS